MSYLPFLGIWSLCGLAVLALALYRKILTIHGDDEFIHLADGEQKLIPQQLALGHKLDAVDKWGKSLTIFTVALGLIIVSVFLFQAWQTSLLLK